MTVHPILTLMVLLQRQGRSYLSPRWQAYLMTIGEVNDGQEEEKSTTRQAGPATTSG